MSFSAKTLASAFILTAAVSYNTQAAEVTLPTLVSAIVDNSVSATREDLAYDIASDVANAGHQFEVNLDRGTPRVRITELAQVNHDTNSNSNDSQSE